MEEQGTVMISIQGPDDKYETTALLGGTPSNDIIIVTSATVCRKTEKCQPGTCFPPD